MNTAIPGTGVPSNPCSSLHSFPSQFSSHFGKRLQLKGTLHFGIQRKDEVVPRAKIEDEARPSKESEDSFNPLSFVTDNPSSKEAIQLPAVPAEDGNVGEMIYRIEDKGREYGSYIQVGSFQWFVRETGPSSAEKGTILFIHGAPTQSYSYRNVMSQMADLGYHCYAPDWLGFGFSEKPEPGYEFSYTEEAYHNEFDKLLTQLLIDSPFCLVTQGFILGSYGLTWCLKNPNRISNLVILNSPLTTSAPIPNLFRQLRFPLLGEFTSQNAVMAERFIEGGSPYVLKNEKADVYRLPYLSSSGPGFALLEATRKASFKNLFSRITDGFSSTRWNIPTLVTWGISDKYLPPSEAEMFQKSNSSLIKVDMIEGAGHMPQEDWPEKVVGSLKRFLQ
eukprot:TRINITY_DN5253_c0_g1_i1.p1 TRINITY_DN5253_c0_g1~~TRINITY_DN5253_c0_g1_i1.p1  ORF type:complete len:391 (-),score=54.34 TRINITY_DN5253_c0_g1_i1:159-1331(-)